MDHILIPNYEVSCCKASKEEWNPCSGMFLLLRKTQWLLLRDAENGVCVTVISVSCK